MLNKSPCDVYLNDKYLFFCILLSYFIRSFTMYIMCKCILYKVVNLAQTETTDLGISSFKMSKLYKSKKM